MLLKSDYKYKKFELFVYNNKIKKIKILRKNEKN